VVTEPGGLVPIGNITCKILNFYEVFISERHPWI
jgi:hypothetical protein